MGALGPLLTPVHSFLYTHPLRGEICSLETPKDNRIILLTCTKQQRVRQSKTVRSFFCGDCGTMPRREGGWQHEEVRGRTLVDVGYPQISRNTCP